jgi:hypothetical protein
MPLDGRTAVYAPFFLVYIPPLSFVYVRSINDLDTKEPFVAANPIHIAVP